MINKINRLRKLLNRQLTAKEKDWEEIKKISQELDSLICQYWNMEECNQAIDDETEKKLV